MEVEAQRDTTATEPGDWRADAREFLGLSIRVPGFWLAIVLVAALVSMLDLEHPSDGETTVTLHVTTLTAVLIALAWLPALLSVWGLVGGKLTAGGGQATTPGFLNGLWSRLGPEEKQAVAPSLVAAAELAERAAPPEDRPAVQRIKETLEEAAAPTGLGEVARAAPGEDARARLDALASQFDALRKTPEGPERLYRMSAIVAEARACGRAGVVPSSPEEYEAATEGRRVCDLGLVQGRVSPSDLDLVVLGISTSKSAFEQYEALVAGQRLLPVLDKDQKDQLANAIRDQMGSGSGKWILPGTDRRALAVRILEEIG